jgi:hypothetical protein
MIDFLRFTNQQQISYPALTPDIQRRLIALGVPLLLTETEGRLALAERKIANFERKYHTTMARLQRDGLPDDASMEMHEDFVEWSGWQATQEEAVSLLAALPSTQEIPGVAVIAG